MLRWAGMSVRDILDSREVMVETQVCLTNEGSKPSSLAALMSMTPWLLQETYDNLWIFWTFSWRIHGVYSVSTIHQGRRMLLPEKIALEMTFLAQTQSILDSDIPV